MSVLKYGGDGEECREEHKEYIWLLPFFKLSKTEKKCRVGSCYEGYGVFVIKVVAGVNYRDVLKKTNHKIRVRADISHEKIFRNKLTLS